MNMRNIRLTIEYDGTRYHGWQSPKKDSSSTIAGRITEVLRKMTEEDVILFCGERTEPGVHAVCQTVNFKTESRMSEAEMRQYLNHYLPLDIAVREVAEVPERFHAELNPHTITYRYRILVGDTENVFQRKYVDFRTEIPDIGMMKSAVKQLIGKHDFRGFSAGKTKKSTEREILDLQILNSNRNRGNYELEDENIDEEKETFHKHLNGECISETCFWKLNNCNTEYKEVDILLKANGFLKQMSQKIIGTLLDIGYSKREITCIESIFAGAEPASQNYVNQALFLEEADYRQENVK